MAQSKMRGYNVRVIRPPINPQHKCTHCTFILRNPVQANCGDRFCKSCIGVILQLEHPSCPECKEKLIQAEVFRDLFAERETLSLEIYCRNKDEGCDWEGVLRDYDSHIQVCQYRLVQCPNDCGEMVVAIVLDTHMAKQCLNGLQTCPDCGMQVKALANDTHLRDQCTGRATSCEFCGNSMKRKDLHAHWATICTEYIIKCDFVQQGCQETFPRRLRDEHNASQMSVHLVMVSRKLEERDGDVRRLTKQLEDVTRMVNQIASTQATLAAAGPPTTSTGLATSSEMHAVEDLAKENLRRIRSVENRQKETEEGLKKTNLLVESDSKLLSRQEVQLADVNLRSDILDVKTTSGVLLWKIGDIYRRRREAQSGRTPSLYSAPFYTSHAGYKMCARIYLDGDGMGRGTHMSLFFVIMRGEYDALLPWPFQLRVTMMLMDQTDHIPSRRNITEVFKPDHLSASFKKPTSEMNTGSGCPMFADKTLLDSSRYVKDETIFVKIIVDTKSLMAPDSDRL